MQINLQDYLMQVSPEIDLTDWHPTCPVCVDKSIQVDPKSYFVFAQRHWCYGSCATCKKQFLLDVPTLLYGLWFPQMMDLDTGKVYGPGEWWNWWKLDMVKIYFDFFAPKPASLIQQQQKQQPHPLAQAIRNATDIISQRDFRHLVNSIERRTKSLQKKVDSSDPVKPGLKIIRKNPQESDRILLMNCLDEFYGHSTRFIQFVYNLYDEIGEKLQAEGIHLVALVPEALVFYTPDFVDEVWVATHLPNPFGRGTFRDREFNQQLNVEIQKRQVFVPKKQPDIGAGVDARRYFHLDAVYEKATLQLENASPTVVFYHREDYRCWGGHPRVELKNYAKLAALIKATYPSAGIYLVGLKQTYPIDSPHIVDLRGAALSTDYHEARVNYLYLLAHTDCAIGIHGSHITEMSALAKTVITLQPRFKYRNYSDDLFLIRSSHFIADYQRFYSLFGSDYLDDVSAQKVFELFDAALWRMKEQYQHFI